MSDLKTSLLVNRQVPEFIREEYPLFITFLEAYYEFLEQKQGTQLNDLTKVSKDLKFLSDVDESIDDFEEQFFNTYASLVSRDVAVDKDFLIKNVLPLYLAKGSENSFKLLFRLLFGQELNVTFPKNDVLRASDGKWVVDNVIKVTRDVYTEYTGDGTTKTFLLGRCRCPITAQELPLNITVYIDGVLQTTGFFVRQEIHKLYFNVAPPDNSIIKIVYRNFDFSKLTNRKITGLKSGSYALVERAESSRINNEQVLEFYVSPKTVVGNFSIGETFVSDVFHESEELVPIYLNSFSSLLTINIIDGGANYNVGDPVPITAPLNEREPKAFISKTFSGKINQTIILDGGAGFKVASNVRGVGIPEEELFLAVAEINSTGRNTANTFTIFSDIIDDIDPSNTIISAADYGTAGIESSPNVNTVLSQAFANLSYTAIGEISNVSVLISELVVSSTPTLNAEPAFLDISPIGSRTSNSILKIDTFGSLGKCEINSGGSGYQIGDELIFQNQPMTFGIGAEAEVTNVSTGGAITEIQFVPSKIEGTANVTSASNVMVQGINTFFLTDIAVGNRIKIGANTRTVVEVNSDTSLNVDFAFGETLTNQKVRVWDRNLLGGQGYIQDRLPTVSVSTSGGSGANITVTTIMGDGEDLFPRGTGRPGEIEQITITDPGKGIRTVPQISLVSLGNGEALANAEISPTLLSLPGRWTSSDSILSSADRKIQGRDFYINYSYFLSSGIEFSKYKNIFKQLLHPAGFKSYAELNRINELEQDVASLDTLVLPKTIRTISGTVNVNSTIIVVGSGTRFNVANSSGLLTVGSYIAINSEIRMVNAIISNTVLTVSSPFTITANNEELIVINTAYEAIATEVTLDEIIAENELILTVES